MTESAPQTWHHGLVAEWWAEFEVEGPEIEYFGRFVDPDWLVEIEADAVVADSTAWTE